MSLMLEVEISSQLEWRRSQAWLFVDGEGHCTLVVGGEETWVLGKVEERAGDSK